MNSKIFLVKKLLYYIKIYGFLEVYRVFCKRKNKKYELNDYKIYAKRKKAEKENFIAFRREKEDVSKEILIVRIGKNCDVDVSFGIKTKSIFNVSEEDIKRFRYFLFMRDDTFFLEDGLGYIYKTISKNNDYDFIYADSDNYISEDVKKNNREKVNSYIKNDEVYGIKNVIFYNPMFKPDFSPEYLEGYNYIGNAFLVSTKLCDIADFNEKNNDLWDFIFKYTEKAKKIYHLSEIVFHEIQNYNNISSENEIRTLEKHFKRLNEKVTIKKVKDHAYLVNKIPKNNPKISIVVPNKDHINDLKRCMDSFNKSTYKNIEWIIVENNSEDEETFLFYDKISKEENVKVIYYKGHFNFSKISNIGAKASKGELLLFLNNDTELLDKTSLEKMVGDIGRDNVGIVGAKLFYPDRTVQHAGVIVEVGGFACHSSAYILENEAGYMNRALVTNDFSAVTAACLLIKRDVFKIVGGFNEELEVAANDVDLCMKVKNIGYRIICEMGTDILHYESKSRGDDRKDVKKAKRLQGEVDRFSEMWRKELIKGDPYYNKNLSRSMAYEIALKKQEWHRPFFYR